MEAITAARHQAGIFHTHYLLSSLKHFCRAHTAEEVSQRKWLPGVRLGGSRVLSPMATCHHYHIQQSSAVAASPQPSP
jgi:hypothetical protein